MVPNADPGPGGIVGTHPLSLDFDGNAIVLSDTLALAWTPAEILDGRVKTICDDKLDTLPPIRRAFLQAILPDRALQSTDRFHNIVGGALKTPPAGAAWKQLAPHRLRGQLEILLGPGNYLGPGVQNPGLLWSEQVVALGPLGAMFASAIPLTMRRRDFVLLASLVGIGVALTPRSAWAAKTFADTFNRADSAFNGSTSSDGLFTWSVTAGTAARVNVVSNQCRTTRAGTDEFPTLLGSVPLDTADGYAWTGGTNLAGTATYIGPLLRNKLGIGGATDTGYYAIMDAGFVGGLFGVYRIGTPDVTLASVASGGVTTGDLYLSFVGSTWFYQRNGVTLLSGTDTAWTGAVGERKVGFLTAVGTDNTSIVDCDYFFAGDIVAIASGGLGLLGVGR
jgi:hypothetical protein